MYTSTNKFKIKLVQRKIYCGKIYTIFIQIKKIIWTYIENIQAIEASNRK